MHSTSSTFLSLLLLCLLAGTVICQSGCTGSTDVIKIKLSRTKEAQYAGYYAALEKNYYSDACLQVFIDDSTTTDVLSEVLNGASVTFGSYWTQKYLEEIGNKNVSELDVIHIGQMLYKSGFFLASLATSDNIIKGKRISLWNGYEAEAEFMLINKYGISPTDYRTVPQQYTVVKLFDGDVDFVSCNRFEEYAQLLKYRKAGTEDELWQPGDLKMFEADKFNSGFLKDGIIVKRSWFTGGPQARDIALRFMKATLRGWMYCRDYFDACITILNLAEIDHSTWQLNEILDSMWTGEDKVGTMNMAKLQTTLTGLQTVGAIPRDTNITNYFDFTFINDVHTHLFQDLQGTSTPNLVGPYTKQSLSWCWDKRTQKSVLCFRLDDDSVVADSSTSNTNLIIGVVIGVTGGVIIIALIFALTAFAIIFYFNRKPSRMKVPLFKDMNSVAMKDVSTKAEFRSLLKNYDFVSVITKKSAADETYAKDVRRALVYFHVNNGTLLDMFDFFLVKELEAHKSKKKKNLPTTTQPAIVEHASDSSTADDSDSEAPSAKHRGSKKKSTDGVEVDSTLFREDSLVTDIFRYYSQLVGLYYLWYILSYPVRKLDKFGKKQNKMKHKKNKKYPGEQHLNMQVFGLSVEVDPKKISLGDVTINKLQLQILAQQIFVSITRSVDTFPELLRDLLKKLEDRVMEYEGDDAVLKTMSNFVFLRYICAALICPQEYGLLDATPGDEMQRIMILLSKVMQNLANGTLFEKEEYMMEMNDFIKTNLQPMKKFLKDILEGGERHSAGEGMEVPFHVEEAGVSVLYHFCSDNRRKVSKVLADLSSETGWLFDEIFPEDSSDESDKDLEQG